MKFGSEQLKEAHPIAEFTRAFRKNLEEIYKEAGEPTEAISSAIKRMDGFFEFFDRKLFSDEQIRKVRDEILALQYSKEIQTKKGFVDAIISVTQPFIQLRAAYPKEFEEAQSFLNNKAHGYIELNRLVSYEKMGSTIKLHHSTARTIGPSLRLYYDAMRQLAKIVKDDPEIHDIQAVSWIVSQHPGLFTRKGFTVEVLDDEKNKAKTSLQDSFSKKTDEGISLAQIGRDKFIEVFGKESE